LTVTDSVARIGPDPDAQAWQPRIVWLMVIVVTPPAGAEVAATSAPKARSPNAVERSPLLLMTPPCWIRSVCGGSLVQPSEPGHSPRTGFPQSRCAPVRMPPRQRTSTLRTCAEAPMQSGGAKAKALATQERSSWDPCTPCL